MTVSAWRVFEVEVARLQRLSPSFVRVTFTGKDLDCFADNGYDQRIKLVLPLPGSGLAYFPCTEDWYAQWRGLPDERRNPVRTYTVRAVRSASREVDVDLVLHTNPGPAGLWAAEAQVGAVAALIGPEAGYPGDHGGRDFHPHHRSGPLLIAGDETAAPAIASIVESLEPSAQGVALIEVPEAEDAVRLADQTRAPAGVRVSWLARDGAAHGSRLIPAVEAAARQVLGTAAASPSDLPDVDVDSDLLWEVPESGLAGAAYAWLAGEAGVIKALRRHLVSERGLDRGSVAFMGYWRLGRPEL